MGPMGPNLGQNRSRMHSQIDRSILSLINCEGRFVTVVEPENAFKSTPGPMAEGTPRSTLCLREEMIGKHGILAERGSILNTGDSKRKGGTEDDDLPPRGPTLATGPTTGVLLSRAGPSWKTGAFLSGGPFLERGRSISVAGSL